MSSYIITGAGGNLGRQLCNLLAPIGNVLKIRRDDFNSDKIKEVLLRSSEDTTLIHLAWPIKSPYFRNSDENAKFLEESIKIFSQIRKFNLKIIGAGSFLEAGDSGYVNDTINPNPQCLYAEAKCKMQEYLSREYEGSYKWIRVSQQISAFDAPFKLTPLLLSSYVQRIQLNAANNVLDLIHVEDVARAFMQCAINFKNLPEQVVVGVGRGIQIQDFAHLFNFSNITAKKVDNPKSLISRPVALRELGWEPKFETSIDLFKALQLEITEVSRK
jgi:nucleoside-diphosphate-sugar epimerase